MTRQSDSIARRWKMTQPESTPSKPASDSPAHEMEEYAGGYSKARVGHIPVWLLVVYGVLFIWALFFVVTYWGGLWAGRFGCRLRWRTGVGGRAAGGAARRRVGWSMCANAGRERV